MNERRVKGTVSRLVVWSNRTSIRLDFGEDYEKVGPNGGYFNIEVDDPKHGQYYNSLFSMALAAAVNRLTLDIKTQEDITLEKTALVDYMVIDW